jgi:hypothetical protein
MGHQSSYCLNFYPLRLGSLKQQLGNTRRALAHLREDELTPMDEVGGASS